MSLPLELGSFQKSVMDVAVEVCRWIVTDDGLEGGVTHDATGLYGP